MPGDDLRKSPYFTKTNDSPIFNQLFAALYDLILCRITKMSSLAPSPGRDIDAIFQEKIPKINPEDETERERFLISPELIAYLKWLIYTAAFKEPTAGERGAIHNQFYLDWVSEIVTKEKAYRKRLLHQLRIWYAKHSSTKKRGRESIEKDTSKIVPDTAIALDDWEANSSDDGDDGGAPAGGAPAGGAGGAGL